MWILYNFPFVTYTTACDSQPRSGSHQKKRLCDTLGYCSTQKALSAITTRRLRGAVPLPTYLPPRVSYAIPRCKCLTCCTLCLGMRTAMMLLSGVERSSGLRQSATRLPCRKTEALGPAANPSPRAPGCGAGSCALPAWTRTTWSTPDTWLVWSCSATFISAACHREANRTLTLNLP